MGHDKTRSSVSVGAVDWDDPTLDALLQKIDGWKVDNRSDHPLQEVQIQISSGWTASSVVSKPAQLISMDEGAVVLVTRFPLPQGDRVRVDTPHADGTRSVWGWVAEGREGHRAADREHGLFLSKLRID